MPVFNCYKDNPPEWSEADVIEIIRSQKNEVFTINNHSDKEIIFVGEGKVLLKTNDKIFYLLKNEFAEYNINDDPVKEITAVEQSVVIRIGGDWGENTGSCGVFELDKNDKPLNQGDTVDYERNTYFDNHYHDCDEFWIIFEGKGEIVTEGKRYKITGGDCVATKAGDHHDFPIVTEKIMGVWFETTLKGKQREGHLWNHNHKKNEVIK